MSENSLNVVSSVSGGDVVVISQNSSARYRGAQVTALADYMQANLDFSGPVDVSDRTVISTGTTKARYLADRFADIVNLKDYGAVGDGVTDDTVAIQTAVDSGRPIFVPYGQYKLTATILLRGSYSSIIGSEDLPYFYIDPNIGPAFKICTYSGASINEWSRIQNVAIWATAMASYLTPSTTNCAISIDGSTSSIAPSVQRAQVKNVRVLGFGCSIFFKQHVNTLVERVIIENHTDWSGNVAPGVWYVGLYFDGTPFSVGGISPNASTEIVNCIFNGNFAPSNTQGIGFRAYGQDIRDIFFDRCETSGGNMGWWIQSTSSDYDCDVIIRRPIIDTFKQAGIYIINVNGPGAVSIEGGYIAPSIAYPASELACVWIENSTCVSVTGVQILGFNNSTATDDGIRIRSGSKNCSIVGNTLINLSYGISVQNSSFNTIVGNSISATTTALEPVPTLSDGIRLFGTSVSNVVCGNVITGRNATYKYATGINIVSATDVNNSVSGNMIDVATVTTPYITNLSWTPVVTSSGGSITSYSVNSSRYKIDGNLLKLDITVTITNNGTGSGEIDITLPALCKDLANYRAVSAGLNITSGKGLIALINRDTSTNLLRVKDYSGAYPATTGDVIAVSCEYEIN